MSNDLLDWQLKKEGIVERSQYMLKTELWSDCSFLVGSKRNKKVFKAHKMFLAMASPVFEAMFYGGLSQDTFPIRILDVEPDSFRVLLEYIYTDEVKVIGFDHALEVCYAANKYMLPHLERKCTDLVLMDLAPGNVCRAYEFATLLGNELLMENSLNIIRTDTEDVLINPTIEEVQLSTLLTILDCPELNISSERDLFNAVNRWAVKECARRGLADNQNSLRSVIGPALTKIHFLTLTPKQFTDGPCQAALLTKDESHSILMNISSPGTQEPLPPGFSNVVEPRPRFAPVLFHRKEIQPWDDYSSFEKKPSSPSFYD